MAQEKPAGGDLRRIRIVCVSDTHNTSPLDGAFNLPKGDILVHAGDLTNQGSFSELQRAVNWIEKADFECKIVIAGNHDITLDEGFYTDHGARFHNQRPEDPEACRRLLTQSRSITYLNHESRTIRLTAQGGPRTSFKVFGSPYSPESGLWAFGYPPEQASNLWDRMPLDADIVVTHTPPKGACDMSKDHCPAGCEALRHSLGRVRPRLAVCGHVHEGRGVERVLWDAHGEISSPWIDPGRDNKKLSMVDLTGRRGTRLHNDGLAGIQAKGKGQSSGQITTKDDWQEQALSTGRRETCIVNAAVMASSWPHKQSGGRKLNKPIVVDLDLPVHDGDVASEPDTPVQIS